MSLNKRLSGGLFLAGALLLLGGCATKHTFRSTPELPATVLLSETSTDKVLWSMDVPVQHKVVVAFTTEGHDDMFNSGSNPPTHMEWTLETLNGDEVSHDSLALPGTNVLLNVQYRPAPEKPGVTPLPKGISAKSSKAPAAKSASAKPAPAPPTTAPAGKS